MGGTGNPGRADSAPPAGALDRLSSYPPVAIAISELPPPRWPDEACGAAAVRAYRPMIRAEARRLARVASRTGYLDEDDLVAEASIAVLEAIASHEPWGVEERTWVRTRIRQRLVDALRRASPLSRDELRRVARMDRGEALAPHELRLAEAARARQVLHFESERPGSRGLHETIGSGDPPVDEAATRHLLVDRLHDEVQLLRPRLREVVEAVVERGVAPTEVARTIQVSNGRVSQLLAEALVELRGAFGRTADGRTAPPTPPRASEPPSGKSSP